jgi:4-carboxymuconolactone decarboxylase
MADEADDRLARGMKTALELFTPKSTGKPRPPSFQYPAEIAQDWNKFSISTVMGDVWGRPGLEPKQRAMITIGVLTALDKPEQLRSYITAGLNVGLTREEICEIILQISVYAGFPTAIQGFGVANEVFSDQDGE